MRFDSECRIRNIRKKNCLLSHLFLHLTGCLHYQTQTPNARMEILSVVGFNSRQNLGNLATNLVWPLEALSSVKLTDKQMIWHTSPDCTDKHICHIDISVSGLLSDRKDSCFLVSAPVCRDPCVRAGGDHCAHLAAGQLPGHSGLHYPAALLSRESQSHPSTVQKVSLQESAAWHRW